MVSFSIILRACSMMKDFSDDAKNLDRSLLLFYLIASSPSRHLHSLLFAPTVLTIADYSTVSVINFPHIPHFIVKRDRTKLSPIMKLSLTSFLLASTSLSLSSAFVVQPTGLTGRTSVVAHASRAATKKASRAKWVEARGISTGGAATVEASTSSSGIMKNDAGLEYVKLVHPDTGASAEVYLFGGVVTSYKDSEGTEFIAVRPDAKMDGSKPISGGLSHCWPQVSKRKNQSSQPF